MSNDTIDFYDGDKLVASVLSSAVPTAGQKISIRKQTWTIIQVSYALDYSDNSRMDNRILRVSVDLVRD